MISRTRYHVMECRTPAGTRWYMTARLRQMTWKQSIPSLRESSRNGLQGILFLFRMSLNYMTGREASFTMLIITDSRRLGLSGQSLDIQGSRPYERRGRKPETTYSGNEGSVGHEDRVENEEMQETMERNTILFFQSIITNLQPEIGILLQLKCGFEIFVPYGM